MVAFTGTKRRKKGWGKEARTNSREARGFCRREEGEEEVAGFLPPPPPAMGAVAEAEKRGALLCRFAFRLTAFPLAVAVIYDPPIQWV